MATSDVGWSESKILDFLELVLLERNEDCNSDSRDNWRSSGKKNRKIVYKISKKIMFGLKYISHSLILTQFVK